VIGIVVVSHSRALADAAVALAREMVPDPSKQPTISVAAGLDETTFGTDATAVSAAIEEADSPDGVLVMMDLGSAVLSADMAKEFLDPDVAERVRLSSAPFVEGLLAAVVTASTGASMDSVVREADAALLPKAQQVGDDEGSAESSEAAAAPGGGEPDDDAKSLDVTLANEHGLHARPGARLVSVVGDFDAEVTAENTANGRGPVDADSVIMLATLGAESGHTVRFVATGPDADAALQAISDLAARNFDDD
jgi:dihydroxyacetone kinase phosphotransfer subunit